MFIDLYCERTGPEFWNEPLNAVSNLAFLVAAAIAWGKLSRREHHDIWEQAVVLLAGSIGIGSFLFHTFASSWSELADVLPIWGFVASYTLLTIYRTTGEDGWKTFRSALIAMIVALTIHHFTGNELVSSPDDAPLLFNGSIQYAPALAALAVFSILAHVRHHPARHGLLLATLIFCAALFFRSMDLVACTLTKGVGTHFLWHVLNGCMIGILLNTLITQMPPGRSNHLAE